MSWQEDLYNDSLRKGRVRSERAPETTSRHKGAADESSAAPASAGAVIRQSRREPNKTEKRFLREWLEPMLAMGSLSEIGDHESITLRIANGVRYSPDFPTWAGDQLTFYEVKGSRVWEDSLIKLKVAANQYPHFRFILCKYEKGEWVKQEVLA